MKVLLIILISIAFTANALSQNFFSSKIAAGVHFNSEAGSTKYSPGLYISGYVEPRISSTGNIVFNIDCGIFRKKDVSLSRNDGKYAVLVGYKNKFFVGKSNYYIAGLTGAMYGGFGFKAVIGYEKRILRTSLISLDAFYCKSVSSNDSNSDKITSLIGITLGAALIHEK
ncbi:MAG: hypothetical protein SGI89_14845 [bacterium]|nr:hypothetical protein [bacterium]